MSITISQKDKLNSRILKNPGQNVGQNIESFLLAEARNNAHEGYMETLRKVAANLQFTLAGGFAIHVLGREFHRQ